MLRRFAHLLPWLITALALYLAFRGVDWQEFFAHLRSAKVPWLLLAALLTSCSYLMRARRWQGLFPSLVMPYIAAARVLVLGFFMNNILPARAGELVRAHVGGRITGQKRTLVLATIASERLADGLTLSIIFVLFSLGTGDKTLSDEFLLVAMFFGGVALTVVLLLIFRKAVFAIFEKIASKLNHKASDYTFSRMQLFIDGLSPLCSAPMLPGIIFWSVVIWSIEILVFLSVSNSFDAELSLPQIVLFLVSVNFSSLIPAAPSGIGVIEYVTSAVLVSIGLPKEQALTMVLTQHAIQYLVVGIPGAVMLLKWKKIFPKIEIKPDDKEE